MIMLQPKTIAPGPQQQQQQRQMGAEQAQRQAPGAGGDILPSNRSGCKRSRTKTSSTTTKKRKKRRKMDAKEEASCRFDCNNCGPASNVSSTSTLANTTLPTQKDCTTDAQQQQQQQQQLRKPKPIYQVRMEDFELLKVLGTGAYGKVFLVRKLTGHDMNKLYAMKILRKEIVAQKTKTLDHTKTERKVLEAVRNEPFLVTMHYAFQTKTKLHLILDYVNGGELFTHLYQRDHFKEDDVTIYIGELILALEKLHKVSNNISHFLFCFRLLAR